MRGFNLPTSKWFYIKALALLLCSACVGAGVALAQQAFPLPLVRAITPPQASVDVAWDQPITIDFDRLVDSQRLKPSLEPAVEGEWRYEGALYGNRYYKRLIFQPATSYVPNQQYHIFLKEVVPLSGRQSADYSYEFRTTALPSVKTVSILDNQQDVAICQPITVTLDRAPKGLALFTASVDKPGIPLSVESQPESPELTIRRTDGSCFEQGAGYVLTLMSQANLPGEKPAAIVTRTFTTRPPLKLINSDPQGSAVLVSADRITLTFDQDVASAEEIKSKVVINPPLEGEWKMENSHTAFFVPAVPLAYATTYQLTVAQGLKGTNDRFLAEEAVARFSTIGRARVTAMTPKSGARGVKTTTVASITFDQEIDHASAEQHFSISPAIEGTKSWNGNTLSFKPTGGWAKDTVYAVRMESGVKSIHGLDTDKAYVSSFTSEESVFLLSVPLYKQQKPLSCEVAALRMALAFKGVNVSEESIMQYIPVESAPRSSDNIWADPDEVFVGDINGKQNTTGYGVHAAPVAKAAKNFRNAELVSGWSLSALIDSVKAGNPVVMWGIYSGGTPDSWTTSTGKVVKAWKGEHARTVVGFVGPAEHPRQIITLDPVLGKMNWNTSDFLANWATLGNQGVVVY